jgi:thiamine-monophosphate kinase
MKHVLENSLIERLTQGFARNESQINGLQDSDAELLRLPGCDLVLALTTDSLAEELEVGLYRDPYLIGWMAVTVNASDLAAVGAEPVGVLLSETIPPDADDDFLAALQRGVSDACSASGLHVLGGDTNFSPRIHMSATALGVLADGPIMTRKGCRPRDAVFASGPLGLGSAFALTQFQSGSEDPPQNMMFKPRARVREGQMVRHWATSCMDTSDGVIPTLDQLVRLNDVGIKLAGKLEDILHPDALYAVRAADLPEWFLLAGPHGEFELLFTVPRESRERFSSTASALGWEPIEIGEIVKHQAVTMPIHGRQQEVDTTTIRNLFTEVRGDVNQYVAKLVTLHEEMAKTTLVHH